MPDAHRNEQLVATVVAFVEMFDSPFRHCSVSQRVVETGPVGFIFFLVYTHARACKHTHTKPGKDSTPLGVASWVWNNKIIPEHFYSISLANLD